MSETMTLEQLAEQWRNAKHQEEVARERRIEIEADIIAQTGAKEEGSQMHKAGEWKVTVTGKLNRKLDADKWAEIEPSIPEALRPVSYEPKLDTKGAKYLENNEPDIWRRVAEAIETKPAKPAVVVK